MDRTDELASVAWLATGYGSGTNRPRMNERPRGLDEVLITEAIASLLRDLGDDIHAIRDFVRPAEAPDRIALHLGRIVQRP